MLVMFSIRKSKPVRALIIQFNRFVKQIAYMHSANDVLTTGSIATRAHVDVTNEPIKAETIISSNN